MLPDADKAAQLLLFW